MAMPNVYFPNPNPDNSAKPKNDNNDYFCTISGYIGSETLFLIFYAKLMLNNYHHRILNEPDRNYSF